MFRPSIRKARAKNLKWTENCRFWLKKGKKWVKWGGVGGFLGFVILYNIWKNCQKGFTKMPKIYVSFRCKVLHKM